MRLASRLRVVAWVAILKETYNLVRTGIDPFCWMSAVLSLFARDEAPQMDE